MTDEDLLSEEGLEQLRDIAPSDPSLIGEIIGLFGDSTHEDLERIERGVAAADAELVEAASHRMCGSSASAGAMAMHHITRQICDDARLGQLPSADEVAGLRAVRDRTLAALRAALL